MVKQATLIHGSVVLSLVKMSAGMLVGVASLTGFNLADTYFVAQLGTRELAAMSFTFPVAMLVGSFSLGIGLGAGTVIARFIGQGDSHRVRHLTTDALILAFFIVLFLVTLGLSSMRPFFTMLGATEETLPFIIKYMRIWYIGVAFVIVPMVGNNAIRATGDTLSPSVIMLADLGLNIILDPAFIFGFGPIPAMGIAGAALATVLCRGVALVAGLYVLYRKDMLSFDVPNLQRLIASWKEILHVGMPAATSYMLVPISVGIVLKMVAWFGTAAVAAYGATTRIEMVVLMPLMALATSMVPFIGQNRGARKFERIHSAHRVAFRFTIAWTALSLLVLTLFSIPIAALFSDENEVINYMIMILSIAPLGYGFKGLSRICNGAMNAIGYPYRATLVMILRLLGLIVPAAALGAYLNGISGLIIGIVGAEVLSGLAFSHYVYRLYGKREDVVTGAGSA